MGVVIFAMFWHSVKVLGSQFQNLGFQVQGFEFKGLGFKFRIFGIMD
jgi:hypothetical protein